MAVSKNGARGALTNTAKLGGWLSAGAASVGVLALFGCGSLGERATSGCPDGEVCSAATPEGLRFFGPGMSGTLDNGPATMVVGGTETLRFEDARGDLHALPSHTTVSSAPSTIAVLSSSNGSAVLRADAQGEARIRVLDPASQLLDRVTMRAAPLDHVAPARPLLTNPARELVWAVGRQEIGVALFAADGTRLVDTGATFGDATVELTVSVGSWDSVELQLPVGGASFTVTSGGHTHGVTIPVADTIDDLAVNPVLLPSGVADPLEVNAGGLVCFDLLSRGAAVVGADESFTYRVDGVAIEGTDTSGCVGLPDTTASTTTIEVSAAGLTRTFTARVRPRDGAMSLEGGPLLLPRFGAFGERASLLRGITAPVLSAPGLGI